jgi:hypothetical protein
VINIWIKNGVLVKRDHKDPKDSHDHPSLFVVNAQVTAGRAEK